MNVDEICPVTPELLGVAEHRTNDILKEWGHRLSIWGTTELSGPEGRVSETFTLRDLAMACYTQGARDAIAVAAALDREAPQ